MTDILKYNAKQNFNIPSVTNFYVEGQNLNTEIGLWQKTDGTLVLRVKHSVIKEPYLFFRSVPGSSISSYEMLLRNKVGQTVKIPFNLKQGVLKASDTELDIVIDNAYAGSEIIGFDIISGTYYRDDFLAITVVDSLSANGILVMNLTTPIKLKEEYFNNVPIINITSPTVNQTLYENNTLTLSGNTTDVDVDNVVTVKYQVDSGTVRNLHSAVSDGATPIDFAKSLIYKEGALYDGATDVTSTLDKDVPHTVSMWAEDGRGGKSSIVTRSFFVVPNRAPQVTISPITQQSALINSNVITVSGAVVDLDHNDVTVTFTVNGGKEQQVYQGPPSAFTFNILLANLKTGTNTVIVKATDTYNMSGTKTLNINKQHDAVPVNTAVARYAIQAPTGSAQSILLWITRTLGNLGINAAVSLTVANEAEHYVDLTPTNTGVVNGNREDEFAYQGTASKEKITLKITYNRTDASVKDTIKQISGVLF